MILSKIRSIHSCLKIILHKRHAHATRAEALASQKKRPRASREKILACRSAQQLSQPHSQPRLPQPAQTSALESVEESVFTKHWKRVSERRNKTTRPPAIPEPKREDGMMRTLKAAVLVLSTLLFFTTIAPRSNADAWNKKTIVTFNDSVEIPGQVLPAGT